MDFLGLFSSWQLWITVVTGLLAIYKYLTRNYGYWETQGVPAEKGYPIIGSEISFFTRPVHEVDMERYKRHGKIYGTYMFGRPILNISDPDIIRLILVKDFPHFVNRQIKRTNIPLFDNGLVFSLNDDWKRIRSVVSPTFTTGKMKMMTIVIKEIATRFSQHVLDLAEGDKAIDMKRVFSRFSNDVIASCAFGLKCDSFKNPNHPFIVETRKLAQAGPLIGILFFSSTFLPKWMNCFKEYLMEKIGAQFFVTAAVEIIRERRKLSNQAHIDFIQLMLDAKESPLENTESDQNQLEEQNSEIHAKNKSPGSWTKELSEEEIVAQCATFLMAGHDTIATATSFVAYALALNPKHQEILHQEIDEAFEKHGELDYDIVNKMPYLNAVINETLRLYTIASRLLRQVTEEYTLPNGITIPKNCGISIPVHVLHHDPEFFPNPETFDPERFLPENKDNIKPFTYLPFADGPRNCVAMRFALMEMKFCVAYLLRSVKFTATEETMKPMEFVVGTGSLLPKTVMVKPEKRVF